MSECTFDGKSLAELQALAAELHQSIVLAQSQQQTDETNVRYRIEESRKALREILGTPEDPPYDPGAAQGTPGSAATVYSLNKHDGAVLATHAHVLFPLFLEAFRVILVQVDAIAGILGEQRPV